MLDLALVGTATLLLSIPTFWLGLLLLLFFGLKLEWLPVVGYVSFSEDPTAALLYIVMPVMTLFLHEMGVLIRMARASDPRGAAARLHHPCPRQGPVGEPPCCGGMPSRMPSARPGR